MGTNFEIILYGQNRIQSAQLSQTIFGEIERIEGEISRFNPFSDVSRLNRLHSREKLKVSLYTFECLETAKRIHDETNGAFDVTVSPLCQLWRNHSEVSDSHISEAKARVGMDNLALKRDEMAAEVLVEGVQIDLGGIGKGYAIDQAIQYLRDWQIPAALIHGGQSTVYAHGALDGIDGWEVGFREGADDLFPNEGEAPKLYLKDQALSGSGNLLHGPHIIDPRSGRPIKKKKYSWAVADSGTVSDALSTAFMVMSPEEISHYCHKNSGIGGFLIEKVENKNLAKSFGNWSFHERV